MRGKYHKGIRIEGADEFLLAVNITGHGAPTEDTEAEPGMCYLDEDSEHGDLYKCIGVLVTETRTVYRWKKLAGQEEVERLSEAIADLENKIPTKVGGLTAAQISALDGMFKITSFTKDPTAEYTAFKAAFGIEGGTDEPDIPDEPTMTLTSISVIYSGGDVAVGTALTDLTDIVVTATYSDGSTAAVTGYTLSGEIAEGSNTVTVTYHGKTATFTVTGVADQNGEETIIVYVPGAALYQHIITSLETSSVAIAKSGDVALTSQIAGLKGYPIPIPNGATSTTIVSRSQSGDAECGVLVYKVESGKLTYLGENTYKTQYGERTVDLTEFEGATHIAVEYRINNSIAMPDDYDFSQYSITFE